MPISAILEVLLICCFIDLDIWGWVVRVANTK